MTGGPLVQLAYLASAVLFIVGLKGLTHPETARRGNVTASLAMLLAVVTTLLGQEILDFTWIIVGGVAGASIGVWLARTVEMTAMPQMVAVFNGFGGGASALVAAAEFLEAAGEPSSVAEAAAGLGLGSAGALLPADVGISVMAGTLIGAVTFSGSWVAFAKLQGHFEQAVTYPLQRSLNLLILLAALAAAALLVVASPASPALWYAGLAALSLLLGVLVVLPIGGADMPVVVALLNSYSGLAASAAGFVLANMVLIIAGALVGASGLILTAIMCRAMNRSLANVLFGAFGGGGGPAAGVAGQEGEKTARETDGENAAMLMGYGRQVVIVPGYGLAVAQAQHKLKELADQLTERGVTVKFAIHPVAGRMPGHMNVLLAEADVPYDMLYEPEDVNPEMPNTDVALVVGANDVTNPSARDDPSSPLAGMPIVEVDRAQRCIVLKRSLSPGFAGVENPLFYSENTFMYFGDAADTLQELVQEVKEL